MKKLIFLLLLTSLNICTFAQEGVIFHDLNFDAALAKAKAENKLLFIDCYTSWCGPCKYMVSTIFPMEKVGSYMNPKFVCVKYDMEKSEGPELAKKFGIQGFPTFLILNPDGNVRHRLIGGDEADKFISRVDEAFDDTKATGVLETEYQKGNRDKSFMMKYIRSLYSVYAPNAPSVAYELFQSLNEKERVSDTYWFLFEKSELAPENSELANYVLQKRKKFNKTIGKEKTDRCIYNCYQQKILGVFMGDTTITSQDLERMDKKISILKLPKGEVLQGTIRIAGAKLKKDTEQLLSACEQEIAHIPAEDFPYFSLGYDLQPKLSPAQLKRWIEISKQLAAKSENPQFKKQLNQTVSQLEKK